jgi:hypothetical protein
MNLEDNLFNEVQEAIEVDILNQDQRNAVNKIAVFLSKEPSLTWNGTTYYSVDIKNLLRSLPPVEVLKACKQYLIENSFLLSGPAGTGKTFSVLIATQGYNFTFCAPTFQAAAVLRENINCKVHTLASALGTGRLDKSTNDQSSDDFYLRSMDSIRQQMQFGDGPALFTADKVLIDEASMIGGNGQAPKNFKIREKNELVDVTLVSDTFLAIVVRLRDRIYEFGNLPSKFVFLGDYAQTPPVGTEADNDAELLELLMANEEQFSSLTKVERTDHEDIKELLNKYRVEIDRLNTLRKEGILSSTLQANTQVIVVPFAERVNSKNIYYYNNADEFVKQFIYLYQNRPYKDKYNPNYVSIVNFNNDVNPKTKAIVNLIRTQLFGDASIKYHPGETLLSKAFWSVSDKVTGREYSFEKDSRVFLEKVDTGVKTGTLGKRGPAYSINLPRLTIKTKDSNVTVYAASEYFTKTISNIRNGKRYIGGAMKLTEEEMDYFGLKVDRLSYPFWLELMNLVPDFGYAYVVNNFKIQGSSLKYSMVDESNILTSPASPKKKIQYIYTGLSRGRNKLFVFNHGNLVNTTEIVNPLNLNP